MFPKIAGLLWPFSRKALISLLALSGRPLGTRAARVIPVTQAHTAKLKLLRPHKTAKRHHPCGYPFS
jgi:hypothetical protein